MAGNRPGAGLGKGRSRRVLGGFRGIRRGSLAGYPVYNYGWKSPLRPCIYHFSNRAFYMAYLWLCFLNLTTRGLQPLSAPRVGGAGSRTVVKYPVRT